MFLAWGENRKLMDVDFGTWRPNILIGLSLVAWGIGFGWLGVHDPSKWKIATGMYIVGAMTISQDMKTDQLEPGWLNCLSNNSDILDGCFPWTGEKYSGASRESRGLPSWRDLSWRI